MGISSEEIRRLKDLEIERLGAEPTLSISKSLHLFFSLLLLVLLLPSCTSVRPIVKIGLLAPFEGVHRQSGYAALTAMRQAIADFAPVDVAMMPVALDDAAASDQTERAARKLLQDRSLQALIGPYSPPLLQQLQPLLIDAGVPWLMPLAIDPMLGFVQPDLAGGWAWPLLTAAVEQAAQEGRQRLVLAGWTLGWPPLTDDQARTAFALPLLISDQITDIQPEDAVFWLGSPEAGASYLTMLRAHDPTIPFLLGPQADSPIFTELTQNTGRVFLLIWVDDGYIQWSARYAGQSPTAYLTYRATEQAIAEILGQPRPQSQSWQVQAILVKGE